MMEFIKSWVLNIAAVTILMTILDLLMPEGKIRKLTQLLAGFIVMFVMLNPVLDLLGKGINQSFAGWADEAFLWNHQVQQISSNYQEDQDRQTLELYRRILLSDIQGRLENHSQIQKAKVDIVLNENTGSQKFGEIRKLYINLSLSAAGEKAAEKRQYEQITGDIQKELQQVFLLNEKDIIIRVSGEE